MHPPSCCIANEHRLKLAWIVSLRPASKTTKNKKRAENSESENEKARVNLKVWIQRAALPFLCEAKASPRNRDEVCRNRMRAALLDLRYVVGAADVAGATRSASG
jgi:hypothetical protein